MVVGTVKRVLGNRVRQTFKNLFHVWQRLGVHALPVHFYEPIPDTRTLPDELWTNTGSDVPGVDMRTDAQIEYLNDLADRYADEYDSFPRTEPPSGGFHLDNGSFGSVDAELLYAVVRDRKPERIVEIGSGHSTQVTALALRENERELDDYDCEFVAIEPYPDDELLNGVPELTELRECKVQSVPVEFFETLGPDDLLFVDSSHVLSIGSDVQYEFLEILPRLSPGVVVHVHDVFFPNEYPREWVFEKRRFWNEQYLLQSFLAFNDSFEVILAAQYLHETEPEALDEAIGSYQPEGTGPGSFWMRRTA